LIAARKRADPDDLTRDFFALLIAYRNHDRILPRAFVDGMTEGAFDVQRRKSRACRFSRLVEPQMVSTDGANGCALEDVGAAVGTPSTLTR
jgi:hypothetical protein